MNYDKTIGYWKEHAPGAVLDYGFDMSKVLLSGETISSSTWSSTGGDLSRQEFSGNKTSVFFSNGVEGETYVLTNEVTTSQNRTYSMTLTLFCMRGKRS